MIPTWREAQINFNRCPHRIYTWSIPMQSPPYIYIIFLVKLTFYSEQVHHLKLVQWSSNFHHERPSPQCWPDRSCSPWIYWSRCCWPPSWSMWPVQKYHCPDLMQLPGRERISVVYLHTLTQPYSECCIFMQMSYYVILRHTKYCLGYAIRIYYEILFCDWFSLKMKHLKTLLI